MTVDERLEFLLHSTESLHASSQELHASVRKLHGRAEQLLSTAEEHTKQLAADAEAIRSLARIAEIH